MNVIESGNVNWYPNGQTSISGPVLKLFRALDREFFKIACKYSAEEHRFPIFIPVAELQKVDYLRSFPQLATFPCCLESVPENLLSFSQKDPLGADGSVQFTNTAPVQDILTPAACYHFYVRFQGQTFPKARYLTTLAQCFRRESHYVPMERQWTFAMREIVCIGTSEEVQEFLGNCRKDVEALMARTGIKVSWDVATDPFFNPSRNPKYLLQKIQPSKTEMVFENRLAIGSVNFHRNYFGEAFKIVREGQEAYSGCVAFGVERWISAILNQFGPNPDQWPQLADGDL